MQKPGSWRSVPASEKADQKVVVEDAIFQGKERRKDKSENGGSYGSLSSRKQRPICRVRGGQVSIVPTPAIPREIGGLFICIISLKQLRSS